LNLIERFLNVGFPMLPAFDRFGRSPVVRAKRAESDQSVRPTFAFHPAIQRSWQGYSSILLPPKALDVWNNSYTLVSRRSTAQSLSSSDLVTPLPSMRSRSFAARLRLDSVLPRQYLSAHRPALTTPSHPQTHLRSFSSSPIAKMSQTWKQVRSPNVAE
jgi:hypothetical protein